MALVNSKGNETEDKEQGLGAYLNAFIRDKEAKEKFPGLEQSAHLSLVDDVYNVAVSFMKFKLQETRKSSNFYQNARFKVDGDINGPATTLKFDFRGQANFTSKDAANLHAHLKAEFPNLKLNVVPNTNRPICIVHIGL